MSPFHPTKRDVLIGLIVTLVLGLFLQFDLSLRFTDSSGSDSLLGFKVGFGGRKGSSGGEWEDDDRPRIGADRWLESVETGEKLSKMEKVAGMAEAKVKWGEEGATRSQVLAHAPGKLPFFNEREVVVLNRAGWTIFDQVYLYNGTWFIVTDNPSSIPLLRLMTSTGAEIWNDEESIRGR